MRVWRDKSDIRPGMFWQDAIRQAISEGDMFIACFSTEHTRKNRTYMNTELNWAVDELRKRDRSQAWFIPVVLSGEVPDWDIGGGKTLRDLQWVELNEANWEAGMARIVSVVRR